MKSYELSIDMPSLLSRQNAESGDHYNFLSLECNYITCNKRCIHYSECMMHYRALRKKESTETVPLEVVRNMVLLGVLFRCPSDHL